MKTLAGLLLALAPTAARAAAVGADARDYDAPEWSPYLVGAGIGVLSWLTFAIHGKAIGASSFYATLAGFLGKILAPRHTASLKYFKDHPPRLDWGFVFVTFTILGALISAWTGGDLKNEWLHPMWIDRFGDGLLFRGIVGFAGGALIAFGARLAGGCTSGHGISGTLQLGVSSWLTVAAMFIGGVIVARILYTLP